MSWTSLRTRHYHSVQLLTCLRQQPDWEKVPGRWIFSWPMSAHNKAPAPVFDTIWTVIKKCQAMTKLFEGVWQASVLRGQNAAIWQRKRKSSKDGGLSFAHTLFEGDWAVHEIFMTWRNLEHWRNHSSHKQCRQTHFESSMGSSLPVFRIKCQFWRTYMQLVFVLLRFTRSLRDSDWLLFLSSFAEMLQYFAECDHVNYNTWGIFLFFWLMYIDLEEKWNTRTYSTVSGEWLGVKKIRTWHYFPSTHTSHLGTCFCCRHGTDLMWVFFKRNMPCRCTRLALACATLCLCKEYCRNLISLKVSLFCEREREIRKKQCWCRPLILICSGTKLKSWTETI